MNRTTEQHSALVNNTRERWAERVNSQQQSRFARSGNHEGSSGSGLLPCCLVPRQSSGAISSGDLRDSMVKGRKKKKEPVADEEERPVHLRGEEYEVDKLTGKRPRSARGGRPTRSPTFSSRVRMSSELSPCMSSTPCPPACMPQQLS